MPDISRLSANSLPRTLIFYVLGRACDARIKLGLYFLIADFYRIKFGLAGYIRWMAADNGFKATYTRLYRIGSECTRTKKQASD